MSGKIYRMYIAESASSKMEEVSSVSLVAGKGIEGDRYFTGNGTFSEKLEGQPFVELSLIEKEEIDWFNKEFDQTHEYSDLRRSIVTENIRLNELVDKEFYVGNIKVKGIRLCEPCPHLAETVNSLVLPHMVGKSGLRAQILESGIVQVGEKSWLTTRCNRQSARYAQRWIIEGQSGMFPFSDENIIDSWSKNAYQWSEAVRKGKIESRRLVTNDAIVEAILKRSPQSVLDVGCGEGWLVRELADKVTHVSGVDVVPGLIERAQNTGGGSFYVASYDEIAKGALDGLSDVVVCNFSLLGKESVETLFKAVPSLLAPNGAFIVQTLHPLVSCGNSPYQDGWREGSWVGFGPDFTDPAPWYFRTLSSWVTLFRRSGFRLLEVSEPIHPKTHKPASVIFIAEATTNNSLQSGADVPAE